LIAQTLTSKRFAGILAAAPPVAIAVPDIADDGWLGDPSQRVSPENEEHTRTRGTR
jgi:hypothetical protein